MTNYPSKAFHALAAQIADSVECKYLDSQFEFGNSPIGFSDSVSAGRTNLAIREFFDVLPDDDQWEIINEASCDDRFVFLDNPWECITRYLIANSNFRSDATDAIFDLLKQLDVA